MPYKAPNSPREIERIFGENVRTIRNAKGWMQRELAERVGVHRVTITRIEQHVNAPTVGLACLICNALGVKLDQMTRPLKPGSE